MGHNRNRCPCCNTILDQAGYIDGIRFPAVQYKIYKIIRAAGEQGIEVNSLAARISSTRGAIRANVWHINEVLELNGRRIQCGSGNRVYRLV